MTGEPMELRNVVKEYVAVRTTAFKESTILAAWRKSGICPLNPEIFTEADYAPSITSSTQIQLPKSFPKHLPRTLDASSDDAEFNPVVLEERLEVGGKDGDQMTSEESDSSGKDGDRMTSDLESDSSDSDSDFGPDDRMGSPCVDLSLPTQHRSTLPSQVEDSPAFSMGSQRRTCSSRLSTLAPETPLSTPSTSSSSSNLEAITLQRELNEWRRRVLVAEGKALGLQAERDAAAVHAVLAGQEAAVYKHRLNKRDKKDETSKRFATDARIVTSREGKLQAKREAAKKAAKQKAEEEKRKRKKDSEREDILRRAAQERDRTAFTGNIKSKSKHELQDILCALGLNADGTVAVLQVRINAHFDATPSLKESPQYVALFKTSRKRKHGADDDSENKWPTASPTFHLSPSPIHSSPSPLSHSHPRPHPNPLPNSQVSPRRFGAAFNHSVASSSHFPGSFQPLS
ncbi:hypothetical protein DFJ43DRAFT_1160523 [Lentinula guzmanii]|uniref:Uncharacterized protein n=1 Tax=Lentinula guzmanii TaxID=2804957 RepID=A0AA38JFZ2_9AGAR|nr:hypothetical protein DFJ43DRAFT_1160523 [Lentinula guzmanii]